MFDSTIVFLPTTDLSRTADFYEHALRLERVLDQTSCQIFQTSEAGYLGFCLREQAPINDSVILTLVTEEVDEWKDILEQRGVVIEKPPTYNPEYKIYQMFLRDPNGYLIEVQRFEDPRWQKKAM